MASIRIARYAFEFARREGRKKVTAVHKAAVMMLLRHIGEPASAGELMTAMEKV